MKVNHKLVGKNGVYEFSGEDVIGKGATGSVYRGINMKDKSQVAIKAIDMAQVNNEVTQYLLEGQKKAMKDIKSPHVVRADQIIQEKEYCYIVMEVCKAGTLRDYIQRRGKIPESEAIQLFRKIVNGYTSIIDKHIIHRDLKTANIMLRDVNDPVIIDFGYCEMIMGKRPLIHYNVGSPSYMSPEAYSKSLYSQKSDVWALGIILYEMLTGTTLDSGKKIAEYFQQLKGRKNITFQSLNFSDLVRSLLQGALAILPQERATSHKLKYLIDKAMIGKEMPPSSLLMPMKKINSSTDTQTPRFQYINTNNQLDAIKIDSYPQQRLKAVYSSYEKSQNSDKKQQFLKKDHKIIKEGGSSIQIVLASQNNKIKNKVQGSSKHVHFINKHTGSVSFHEIPDKSVIFKRII